MLNKKQLTNLRKQVVLNSVFLKDYSNNLFISEKTACNFFNGYIEYLNMLASDEGLKDYDIMDIINKYDTSSMLYNYYLMFSDDPLIRDDYKSYCCDTVFSGVLIFEIENYFNEYVYAASYFINKNDSILLDRITKNKIYYDKKDNAYFIKNNKKYFLNSFIRRDF